MAQLRATLLGADRAASLAAARELTDMGEIAAPTLADGLRLLLNRDRGTLEQNVRKAATQNLSGLLQDAATLRKAYAAQLAAVKAGPASSLRPAYEALRAASAKADDACSTRLAILDLAQARPDYVRLYQPLAAKAPSSQGDAASEAKLQAAARTALGGAAVLLAPASAGAAAASTNGAAVAPSAGATSRPASDDAELAAVRQAQTRRLIERYNDALLSKLDPAEVECVKQLNAYRAAAGVLSLEIDLRLTQSARRHCKEMVDLKFFSGTSPTPANSDAAKRMRSAGFEATGPWIEALGRNVKGGAQMFWTVFETPAYQKALADSANVSVGVGRWDGYWVVDIAAGKQLATATPQEQAAAEVRGSPLAPQTTGTSARRTGSAGCTPRETERPTDPSKVRPPFIPGRGTTPTVPGLPGF